MSRFFLNKPLIVICGPTASGKTELAIKLAKKYNGEIISADSRQIYRGMIVGTASPCQQIQNAKFKIKETQKPILIKKIPHYLLHIIYPNQEFNVAIYKKLAVKAIKDIQKREKIPFLVGGTGLYINAVIYGYKIPKGKPDIDLRKRLERQSNEKLLKKLQKLDPETASNIDPKNKRRLIRALEVCIKTGKPFSVQKIKKSMPYDTLILGIDIPRKKLYQKIDQRTEKMLNQGIISETKLLLKKGYSPNLPAVSGIGYKEMVKYLYKTEEPNNKITKELIDRKIKKQLLEEAIDLIKKNTRNYVKRQITWFKKDKNIKWIKNYNQAEKLIKNFLR